MARRVDGLAPGSAREVAPVDPHIEAGEQHAPGRHLEDQRVQPVDEQKRIVRRLAGDLDRFARLDQVRIADRMHQRHGALLERRLARRTEAAHPDVRLVREVLPAGRFTAHRQPTPRTRIHAARHTGPPTE